MKIQHYTLKFIALGLKKQTYLRYFCTVNGKGETYNIKCNVVLTPDQLVKLNDGTLGGLIQDSLGETYLKYKNLLINYKAHYGTYPTAETFKLMDKSVYSTFNIEYYINQYLHQLQVKPSTKRVYSYNLRRFKEYYYNNLSKYTIEAIISKNIVIEYGMIVKSIGKEKKNITPTHIYNYQVMLIRFLNYIADSLTLPKIDFFLKQPAFSGKWHLSKTDVNRLLAFNATTKAQQDVLDIIYINNLLGLRIGEILNILIANITFDENSCSIRFIEEKKSYERTVVIVDQKAIDIIKTHINSSKSKFVFRFHGHNWFNVVLQEQIAKEVFKEETINIYKNTVAVNGYVDVLKWKAISSHAFRRYGIEQNADKYGMDVARQFSGHKDTAIMYKHYVGYMNEEDLKKKLLKNIS